MKDSPHDTDPKVNAQTTEKIFIKSENIFHLDRIKKIRSSRRPRTQEYKGFWPIFSKLDHFALTFIFLPPKEQEINCSQEVVLKTKLTHTYT